MGENALKVDEGQEVRLYVGNIGPNLTSSFHVIGEQFANVYMEGGSKVTAHDIQTTLIPAGGAAIVEFTAEVPGTYMIVDHSIFRAFYKGAMGQIVVSGPPNTEVFQGKTSDEPYLGEQSFMQGLPYGIQKSAKRYGQPPHRTKVQFVNRPQRQQPRTKRVSKSSTEPA